MTRIYRTAKSAIDPPRGLPRYDTQQGFLL